MDRPNLALVVLDSVPAAKLSLYGYYRDTTPNIDSIAEDSLVFDDVYANSSWTVPTHATLFTGRYPTEHATGAGSEQFSVSPDVVLSAKLSDSGYRTTGFSSNPWVTPEFDFDIGFDDLHYLKPRPLFDDAAHPEEFLSQDKTSWWRKYARAFDWICQGNSGKRFANLIEYKVRDRGPYASAGLVNDRVEEWLSSQASETEPFFLFLNYMDAHEPYDPDDRYVHEFREEPCSVDIDWHLDSMSADYTQAEETYINDLYDASLRCLDEQVGRLTRSLERHGLAEDTLLILTSDHGKCLGERGFMGTGSFLYDEMIRVPLVVSPPSGTDMGETPDTTRRPVSQVDIYSTLLDSAGIDVDCHRNIVTGETFGSGPEGVLSETLGPVGNYSCDPDLVPLSGCRRVDYGGYKLVRYIDSGSVNVSETTYGVGPTLDQNEAKEVLLELESNYLSTMSGINEAGTGNEMSAQVESRLEELGYL